MISRMSSDIMGRHASLAVQGANENSKGGLLCILLKNQSFFAFRLKIPAASRAEVRLFEVVAASVVAETYAFSQCFMSS